MQTISSFIDNAKTRDENPDFIADRLAACKTAGINFTATNINTANIVNYSWTFGDGGVATLNTPSVLHVYTVFISSSAME